MPDLSAYNIMLVTSDGVVISSAVESGHLVGVKTIIGMNVQELVMPESYTNIMVSIHKALDKREWQPTPYTLIDGTQCVCVIGYFEPGIAIVHRSILAPGSDLEGIISILIASSGWLYKRFYDKKTG